MTARIQVFYKGIGFICPVEEVDKWEEFKNTSFELLSKDSKEVLIETLNDMVDLYTAYVDKKINFAKVVEQYKFFDKIFCETDYENGKSAICIWCMNVVCLIQMGALKEDNFNGVLAVSEIDGNIIAVKNINDIHKILKNASSAEINKSFQILSDYQKICKNCKTPSKFKCNACRIIHYCSKACQKTDWKHHKKTCISNLFSL